MEQNDINQMHKWQDVHGIKNVKLNFKVRNYLP